MGSSLLHCNMDDFSKVNETRIKVRVLIRADTLKFDVPKETLITYQGLKTLF